MLLQMAVLSAFVVKSMAQQYDASPLVRTKPEEIKYPPRPYYFSFDSKDDNGVTQFRKESGEVNGRVTGSYGYKDDQGIERIVEYVADEGGYRAKVKTNEPGTDNKSPADVEFHANPIVINYIPKPLEKPQPILYSLASI